MKRIIAVLGLIIGLLGVSCAAIDQFVNDAAEEVINEIEEIEEGILPELAPTLGLDITLTPDPDAPRDLPDGIPPTFTPEVQDLVSGVPTEEGQIEVEFDEDGNLVSEGELHTVQEGETLGEIANQYGVTVEEIIAANSRSIDDIDRIFPGQVIIIPVK